ncbi:uncharacterized protein [Drosophila tropicalis]|uniref:uncharacterized protein n=1 Tax=Drosophila tropicalis TaxID=46794 RepID=UPI0035AC25AF
MRLTITLYLYIILVLFTGQVLSICIPPNHCIEDMEAADAVERFDYVRNKYEEVEMKITGEPVGLQGKLVTHGDIEEQHIVFQYMDNTPHDIIQTCAFVVTNAPGQCESIQTFCSGFLSRMPRPLLERKPLTVCEDGVRETEAETEATAETENDDSEGLGETTAETLPSQQEQQDTKLTRDSELI